MDVGLLEVEFGLEEFPPLDGLEPPLLLVELELLDELFPLDELGFDEVEPPLVPVPPVVPLSSPPGPPGPPAIPEISPSVSVGHT